MGDGCGGGDGAACGREPSCRNECSSLDLGQCLRNRVASIERIEREESVRILHPSILRHSTVVVHHVGGESVLSMSSSDRTYQMLARSIPGRGTSFHNWESHIRRDVFQYGYDDGERVRKTTFVRNGRNSTKTGKGGIHH